MHYNANADSLFPNPISKVKKEVASLKSGKRAVVEESHEGDYESEFQELVEQIKRRKKASKLIIL